VSWRIALLLALACPGVAAAQAAAEACAGIADPSQRLECYDKITTPVEGRPSQGMPPADTPAGAPAPASADSFGQPRAPAAVTEIRARILGKVTTWQRGTQFRLDNGQVWEASERERGYFTKIPDDPEVRIYRGWWGAYWMEILAVDAKLKVKRIS
jgi:hypothetical protein